MCKYRCIDTYRVIVQHVTEKFVAAISQGRNEQRNQWEWRCVAVADGQVANNQIRLGHVIGRRCEAKGIAEGEEWGTGWESNQANVLTPLVTPTDTDRRERKAHIERPKACAPITARERGRTKTSGL